MNKFVGFLFSGIIMFTGLNCSSIEPADIILANGDVYTMEEGMPWASTIAIKGNKITAVLAEGEDYSEYVGQNTRVVDMKGNFIVPGFIDGHTHFSRAGAMLNDANLMTVSDDEGLKKEMQRVVGVIGENEWITGGLWGAYEEWSLGADNAGLKKSGRWEPNRWSIDPYTENNPSLLYSFDRKLYLANTAALKAAGIENGRVENKRVSGMKFDNRGRPTGLIYQGSPAIKKITDNRITKSEERRMNEFRRGLQEVRESGIVEFHDITNDDSMEMYVKLESQGELTSRVWMRADLSRAKEFNDRGIKMGTHPKTMEPNSYLRWGTYKGYIDGIMGNHSALFFEPYDDQPENYGRYRRHTSDDADFKTPNMQKMYNYLLEAAKGGFVANVHAIGTKGTSLMLDTYEQLMKDLGKKLDGYRVIHNQVIRPQDFSRFKELNVLAEVNPYHLSDDMRWMEERIGKERNKGAYAFKSLLDNGAELVFGSDWPGTNAAYYHNHPKYLIHAAVNRTTINGTPEGGWYPEQKISVHEALKAYTINGAISTFEGDIRGSIKVGKLADIAVSDLNLINTDPKNILNMNILMTIVDGKIVYEDPIVKK